MTSESHDHELSLEDLDEILASTKRVRSTGDGDFIISEMAKLIAGLQVPISLGMGRDGILGTAAEPWHRLFEKVGGGWCTADEIEKRLRERLGYDE
jgi:hypothetical protein